MPNITIRSATDTDIPIILGLLYDLGRPKPEKDSDVDEFRRLVRKYLADSDKDILVAIADDVDIVGMASIMFLSRLNQQNFEMYIPELIIHEDSQNKGIGKQLITSCIDYAKEKKCHRIRLESGHQRKSSHVFYKKMGFEQNAQSFSKTII